MKIPDPLLKTLLKADKPQGFTLIELLMVVIISGLIISGLLWVVVDLIRNDNREAATSETQRETQMALDYIVSDLREAVYIYDDFNFTSNSTSYNLTSFIPSSLTATVSATSGSIPVLAFWKTEQVDLTSLNSAVCTTSFTTADTLASATDLQSECSAIKQSRHAYTLVVYVQTVGTDSTWSGESRLRRYELKKYTDNKPTVTNKMEWNQGYVDPVVVGFETWPYSGATNCQTSTSSYSICKAKKPGTVGGSTAVVMDFVAHPWRNSNESTLATLTAGAVSCATGYSLMPRASDGTPLSRSFYACVRNTAAANTDGSYNYTSQDIIVYLKGNAKGRAGTNNDTILPIVQTQITMRGVIDQNP